MISAPADLAYGDSFRFRMVSGGSIRQMSGSPPISDRAVQTTHAVRRPIVVVGGGVIGAACAGALSQVGAPVLLIDKGAFGHGCSYGNCGLVSPSHLLPLSRPGTVWNGLASLFKRNAPLQFRFQTRSQFWAWIWRFARNCNHASMLQAGHARQVLLDQSRVLYEEMFRSGFLEDCDWVPGGTLVVFRSHSAMEEFAETEALLRREFGLEATPLSGEELSQREPALRSGLAGAWEYRCDGHLRPDKLMCAWKKRLLELGVRIREHCELFCLEFSDDEVTSIVTTAGRMEVDQLILCTGAWSQLLRKQLKIRLPVEPGKGYSITLRRPPVTPVSPLIFEEHHVALTPFQEGIRIGSTMEFAGYDKSMRAPRLTLLKEGANAYLRNPVDELSIEEKWYGFRPMSADDVPLIGRVPGLQNVWMAAGHGMLGVSMAPSTAQLLVELLTGTHPHVDPFPYRLERFN
jgi:Glycine/D-amino acid oxidases (deaminating)